MNESLKMLQHVELSEVASLKTGPFGSALHREDYVIGGIPVINPMHIVNGIIFPKAENTVSLTTATRLSEFRVREGDVVLGRRGEMGRAACITDKEEGWLCGTGSLIVRPSPSVNSRYLQRFLSSPLVVSELTSASVGSTMANLNQSILKALEVPIGSLALQKRIADKLDVVLARVGACRERLDRIPAILKRFRQSVLAAATSGKLTEEWRGSINTDKWQSVRLGDICQSITDGDHQAPPQVDAGIPFITISAINDGRLRLDKASRYVPMTYFKQLKAERRPQLGDILFSVTGSFGIPALVDTAEQFTFQRHIAILRPDLSQVSSKYLLFALGSENIREQGLAVATGTAQLTIPLTALRCFAVALPPAEEQFEIVRRIEALFNFIDRVETRYTSARAQVERLTPALLAKAFRGELVPQDPNDEPAEALLERICQGTDQEPASRRSANKKASFREGGMRKRIG